MIDTKRLFLSLGGGTSISISLIAVVFTSKILNGPTWISMWVLWIFAWPIWLFVYVLPAPREVGTAVVALFLGFIIDTAIFSAFIYLLLSLLKHQSRSASANAPPPPVRFRT